MLKQDTPPPGQNLIRLNEDLETGRQHPPGLLMSDLPLHGFIREAEHNAVPGPARMVVSHKGTYYQIIRTGEAAAIGNDNPYPLHAAPPNATTRIGHVAYAVSESVIHYGEHSKVERAVRESTARQQQHPVGALNRLSPVVTQTRARVPLQTTQLRVSQKLEA